MLVLSLLVGLFVGVLLVLFGAQNAQPVSIHFFGWQTSSVPLIVALGLALLLGMLLAFIVSIPGRVRSRAERRRLQRRVEGEDRSAPLSIDSAETAPPDEPETP